jgi:hypothetical protein
MLLTLLSLYSKTAPLLVGYVEKPDLTKELAVTLSNIILGCFAPVDRSSLPETRYATITPTATVPEGLTRWMKRTMKLSNDAPSGPLYLPGLPASQLKQEPLPRFNSLYPCLYQFQLITPYPEGHPYQKLYHLYGHLHHPPVAQHP